MTHDERYAAAAVRQLHAWFVDPATRMNPNLQYAQSIKGVCTGRGIGIIDTVRLAEVALGVIALRGSPALPPGEVAAITGWFRDYLHWIRTHPYGIDERNADNNHGTCWALQAACFARLTGDEAVLADCRRRFRQILLPGQMAADGSFPREFARTRAYSYSIFNLDVMTAVAQVLSTPQGKSPHLHVAGRPQHHPRRRISRPRTPRRQIQMAPAARRHATGRRCSVRQPSLIFGALATGREDWLKLWERLPADPADEEIRRNFPIRQPVLWVLRSVLFKMLLAGARGPLRV